MTTVIDIQKAVSALPEAEFMAFSSCFDAYEEARWDRQIGYDQETVSPLSMLMEKAKADYKAGTCKRL